MATKYKNPTLHTEQGGGEEQRSMLHDKCFELGRYCRVMSVSSETRNGTRLSYACLEVRVNSLAGVSGESRPPSSHLMLTKS